MAKGGGSRQKSPAWLTWLRVVVLLLLLGGLLIGYRNCAALFNKQPDSKQQVTLVRVADGDTVVVRPSRGEDIRVRLIGIDTPELGTAASFRSALFAAELLEGARVIHLEPDPAKPRDKYGRTLGWVWIETADGNELLLQEELIRAGLAELYRDAKGSKHFPRLEQASGQLIVESPHN
jgi:endonuclease YncB( thermonuclease family)